jgi:hypothetical protein
MGVDLLYTGSKNAVYGATEVTQTEKAFGHGMGMVQGMLGANALGGGGRAIAAREIAAEEAGAVATRSVWQLAPDQRGYMIERFLGQNLPQNFKTFDKFVNGVATSIKSIDLGAASYQAMSDLRSTLKGFVTEAATFKEYSVQGITIEASQISSRVVDVVIPGTALTDAQKAVLDEVVKFGVDNNVTVHFLPLQ